MKYRAFWPRRGFQTITSALVAALAVSPPAICAEAPQVLAITASQLTEGYDQGQRLETIGYRLARANASQCDRPQMLTGLMLNNIGGYAAVDRPAVSEAYNLTYGFGVLHVVPGSNADIAGFAEGDEIVAVNGQDLASFSPQLIGNAASFDRTEQFVDYLEATLQSGPARLDIRRNSIRLALEIQGAQGCGGRFAVLHRGSLNAWSDGRYVAVTDRMMDSIADDQELAFVVAHEMAHNMLRHAERLKSLNRLFMQFGFGASKVKASEIEADTLAVTLMGKAGFDLDAPERLLRRTSRARWMDLPITHPGISRRIQIVRTAAARIANSPPPNVTAPADSTAWSNKRSPQAALTIR